MLTKNKKVIENIFSLLVLQGSNYLLPLITLPYLISILGVKNYGSVVFVTTLMQFFIMFIDYGYNVIGTRKISLLKNDFNYVKKTFNRIITVKALLTFLSFIILIILVIIVPKLSADRNLYFVGFLSVIGSCIFPIWYFQGIEKMKYITVINIVSKVISTILIFVFVTNSEDSLSVIFFQSLNYLLPGIISIMFITIRHKIIFKLEFNLKDIKFDLIEGSQIFMTNLWINMYALGSVLITGFLAGDKIAGYYSIGQKLISAISGLIQPIGQALYPYLCTLFKSDFPKFGKVKTKLLIFFISISSVLSLFLFVFSDFFIDVVSNSNNATISHTIKISAFTMFFIIVNTQITNLVYVTGEYHNMQKMYFYNALIFICLAIPSTYIFGIYGMLWTVLLIELLVFVGSLKIMKKNIELVLA